MNATDMRMFFACVAIWSTTWLAITWQLAGAAPEVGVALRFGLAAALLAAYCRWRGLRLRFGWAAHRRFMAMGATMFTSGYLCVYYAERHVVSGLVAVGYCASPIVNQWAYRLMVGRPLQRRVMIGGLVGMAGVALIFLPELATLTASRDVAIGALFTAAAVVSSATGNVYSTLIEVDRISVWQKMAWSMGWGAGGALLVGMLTGASMSVQPSVAFVASLVYLTLLGSIVAFAFYLTLVERIGAGRAGYIGVMVPVAALALSALFEGYAWQPLTFAGIALAIAGNVFMLRPATAGSTSPAQER